jgi:hypothetical protein
MDQTKQNRILKAVGALEYLVKINIDDPTLQNRFLKRLQDITDQFIVIRKENK